MNTVIVDVEAIKSIVYRAWHEDPRRVLLEAYRMTYEDGIADTMLRAGLTHHHTAIHPRSIRKLNPISAEVYPYAGRFGIGYTVHRYKEGSDNSHYVDYWIKED